MSTTTTLPAMLLYTYDTPARKSTWSALRLGLLYAVPATRLQIPCALPFNRVPVLPQLHNCSQKPSAMSADGEAKRSKKSKKATADDKVADAKAKKEKKRKLDSSSDEEAKSAKKAAKKLKKEAQHADKVEHKPTTQPTPDANALDNFKLSESIKSLLRSKGIESLFAIQAACFDLVLEGNDVVGRARTGCGKTLAFVLPICQVLSENIGGSGRRPWGRPPSVIVLAPTRELAKQVGWKGRCIISMIVSK
eukprot:GHRR01033981.1.p1 GENE.GHRR01033981.1~~GHRR01033981.1.p1  ORF type:complete len:250 (+),score=47.31 GHRR01033981.1:171-920(+)